MSHALRLRRSVTVGLAVVVAALAAVGSAAPSRADEPASASDTVEFRFDGNTTIPDFLKAASQATGKTILWSAGDKSIDNRRYTSTGSVVVPRAKALQAARALLVPFELVMVPLGPEGAESYYVMNAREQMSILHLKPVPVDLNDENVGRLDREDGLFVTAVIRVRELDDLRDARQALGRISTQNNVGSVTEVPNAKAFIVTDFAPTVASIYRTLRFLDARPARDGGVVREFIRLRWARAANVRSILEEQLLPKRRPPTPGQPAPAASSDAGDDMRLSADVDTNQIVVTCREFDIAKVRRIVEALDVEPAAPAVSTPAPEHPAR